MTLLSPFFIYLKDESRLDSDVLTAEIVENIESALDGFRNIMKRLNQDLQD